MITLYFIKHALTDTVRFIAWMFKWLVIIMFKATVYFTLFVITALTLIIGWIVKKVGSWGLGKAGVDTSEWPKPDWDKVGQRLDSFNSWMERKLRPKHKVRRPSTDITVEEMVLFDIIDGD